MFFFSALKQIRTNLNHGHHKRALAVLKTAMIKWPDCDIFATTELSAEQVDEQRYFDRLQGLGRFNRQMSLWPLSLESYGPCIKRLGH